MTFDSNQKVNTGFCEDSLKLVLTCEESQSAMFLTPNVLKTKTPRALDAAKDPHAHNLNWHFNWLMMTTTTRANRVIPVRSLGIIQV